MAVSIGHARLGSNNKITGDTAGDQNAREVCISVWYNMGGTIYVLRPKTADLATKLVANCKAGCANDKIGYNQNRRNTAHTQAKNVGYNLSKIATACDTDCSAFMTLCAIASGVTGLEYATTGNAPTTSTMVDKFVATGKFEKLSASKYITTPNYLKAGDIVVKPGSHTFMILTNGSKAEATTTTASAPNTTKKNTGVITTTLNIRKESTTSASTISISPLRANTVVDICDSKDVSGTTWYYIKYNGVYGWCSGKYVTKYSAVAQSAYKTTTTKASTLNKEFTTTASLNMRYGAGTSNSVIIVIPKGKKVACNGYYLSVDGVKWPLISYDKYTGYASSKYLS